MGDGTPDPRPTRPRPGAPRNVGTAGSILARLWRRAREVSAVGRRWRGLVAGCRDRCINPNLIQDDRSTLTPWLPPTPREKNAADELPHKVETFAPRSRTGCGDPLCLSAGSGPVGKGSNAVAAVTALRSPSILPLNPSRASCLTSPPPSISTWHKDIRVVPHASKSCQVW